MFVVKDAEIVRALRCDSDVLCDWDGGEGQGGKSCGHHEQVNRKAEWTIRGLLGPVGDTNPASLPLDSRLAVLVFSFR